MGRLFRCNWPGFGTASPFDVAPCLAVLETRILMDASGADFFPAVEPGGSGLYLFGHSEIRAGGPDGFSVPNDVVAGELGDGNPAGHFEAAASGPIDVVLLDRGLEASGSLIRAASDGTAVFAWDGGRESASEVLGRVAAWAEENVAAIRSLSILSHGVAGGFQIGSQWITAASLGETAVEWQRLASWFDDGAGIHVFGCNVAGGDGSGQGLLDQLSLLAGADVYASDDVSGVGGDWDLEAASLGASPADGVDFGRVFSQAMLQESQVSLAWYNAAWQYRQTVTVSGAMVAGSSDLDEFAVLVSVNSGNLRSTGNGGGVGQADGGDLLFTAADGTTKLDHQIESYDAGSGTLLVWVEVPTLSHVSDTSLFLYYGNATAADQWNDAGTWNAGNRAVWHLGGDYSDSTSNVNHLTNSGAANLFPAVIGAGETFNGTSSFVSAADNSSLDITSRLTVSGWFQSSDLTGYRTLVSKGDLTTSVNYYVATYGTELEFEHSNGGLTQYTSVGAGLVADTWYHFAVTYDDASNTVQMYLNGNAIYSTSTATTGLTANSGSLTMGQSPWGEWLSGSLDEIRIASTVRSAGWIATEYNNQISPAGYVTLSEEVTVQLVAVQDTWLNSMSPNSNYGSASSLLVGSAGGGIGNQRSLLQFDLAGLAAGATVSSASLSLQATAISGNFSIHVHQVTGLWEEGSFGGSAGEASWNRRIPGIAWTSPGGDFQTTSIATLNSGTTGEHSWDITGLVQSWVTGSSVNSGLVLGSPDTGSESVTYDSREGTIAPALLITYTVNNAPTLTSGAVAVLTGTDEDTASPPVLAADLLAAVSQGDPDSGAQSGLAVTALTGNGLWQFSTDGALWTGFGAVSPANALLLSSTSQIRYLPDSENGESATFEFHAWDQTQGTASSGGSASYGNATVTGGSSAWSASSATASLVVTAVNDAPVISGGAVVTLAGTDENTASAASTAAAVLAGAGWTDVDSGSAEGLAITSVSGNGTWQYSTDGNAWTGFGAVSAGNALLIDASTQIRYQPDLVNGETATFSFSAWDQSTGTASTNGAARYADPAGGGGSTAWSSQSAGASIFVSPVNDEQILQVNQDLTVAENSTGNLISDASLLTGDSDHLPSQLLYTVVAAPGNGTLRRAGVAIAAGGSFSQADINAGLVSYGHNGSETAGDSFAFTVDDGMGATSGGTFRFTIAPVNDNAPSITSNGGGPTASISVPENTTAVTVVQASDADLPAQPLFYSIAGGQDAGQFGIDSSSGSLIFLNPPSRESPADSNGDNIYEVTVRAEDGTFLATQTLQVTVTELDEFDVSTPIDTSGLADQVSENAASGTPVGITAWAIDPDATSSAVSYSLVDDAGGRFTIDSLTGEVTVADGTLLNRETAAASTITVRATSADGSFADTVFSISLTDADEFDTGPVGDSDPAANSVSENAPAGTPVGIVAIGVDPDATANLVTYSLDDDGGGRFAVDPSSGLVTVAGPLDHESASSHPITVRATSADGSYSVATYTIQVLNVNEAPIGTSGVLAGIEDQPLVFSVGDFGFQDPDTGDTAGAVILETLPAAGQLRLAGIPVIAGQAVSAAYIQAGLLVWQPPLNVFGNGVASLAFRLVDSFGMASAAANILVLDLAGDNDPPTASGLWIPGIEDSPVAGTLLASDLDSPAASLSWTLVTAPQPGAGLVLHPDGSFVYSPPADFSGTDSFVAVVSDGAGGQVQATVWISLQPVNDQPMSMADLFSVFQGSTLQESVGVLANDIDVDQDSLVAFLWRAPVGGTVRFFPDGTFSYTPAAGFFGIDRFEYVISDGQLFSAPAAVAIQVEVGAAGGVTGGGGSGGYSGGWASSPGSQTTADDLNEDDDDFAGVVPVRNRRQLDLASDLQNRADTLANAVRDAMLLARQSGKQALSGPEELDAFSDAGRFHLLQHFGARRGGDWGLAGQLEIPVGDSGSRLVVVLDGIWQQLEELERELLDRDGGWNASPLALGTSTVTAAAALGYLLWYLRGGVLLATFLSQLPAWRMIDPLPVLESFADGGLDESDDMQKFFG